MTQSLTILWPKQDRLKLPFVDIALNAGLSVIKDDANPDEGLLLGNQRAGDDFPEAQLLFRRADDAVNLLAAGEGDLAIVGSDTFYETSLSTGLSSGEVIVLGACPNAYSCRMSFMAATEMKLDDWVQLRGRTVVTAFPNILKQELDERGIRSQILNGFAAKNEDPNPNLVRIVAVSGSVENMVARGSFGSSVGFDMIDTGGSMRRNGLSECTGSLANIMGPVTPVVVVSRAAFEDPARRQQIEAFMDRISMATSVISWSLPAPRALALDVAA